MYKTSCATEDAAVCLTVPETSCEQAAKEIKRQVCSPVQKEHCITVRTSSNTVKCLSRKYFCSQQKYLFQIPKTTCATEPRTECQTVSSQSCSPAPRTACTTVTLPAAAPPPPPQYGYDE